jgi:hypothetical protein
LVISSFSHVYDPHTIFLTPSAEGANPRDLLNLARRLLEKAADPKSDSDEKIAAARKGFDELCKQLLHSGLLQGSQISSRQQPQSELNDLLKTISLVLQDHPDKSLDELLDIVFPLQKDDLITQPSLIVSGAAILLAIIATGLASLQHSFIVSTYALTFSFICSIIGVTARMHNVGLWLATGFLGCFSAATMLLARSSENQETTVLGLGLQVASFILIYEACFLTSVVLRKK